MIDNDEPWTIEQTADLVGSSRSRLVPVEVGENVFRDFSKRVVALTTSKNVLEKLSDFRSGAQRNTVAML